MPTTRNRRVAYYLDDEIGDQYYGDGHPMKPNRVRLTHELVMAYGLYKEMDILRPFPLEKPEITRFHDPEYVDFLRREDRNDSDSDCIKYLGKVEDADCPLFDGLFRFVQKSAGASIGAAELIISKEADVAVNWGGGFHHAKKSQASGFCYINDIVLAILRLLKRFERVLYVDIDVHHGDGVEEAFYATDRVLTLSFHKGGNFFPGTGRTEDVGVDSGRFHAINFPLKEGIDDDTFFSVFKPTFDMAVETFRPSAIVLQCGSDSLTRDRLGCFNLTVHGHGACVKHVISSGLPALVLGGGGYTVKNVARCWTYETSLCAGVPIPNEIPYNNYLQKFGPCYKLQIDPSKIENMNTFDYLNETRERVFTNIRSLRGPPSVGMGAEEHGDGFEAFTAGLLQNQMERMKTGVLKREAEGEFFERKLGGSK